jgi:hypothetical protein
MQSEMRNKCSAVAVSMSLKCGYIPSGTFPMSKPYHKEEERRQLIKPKKISNCNLRPPKYGWQIL